MTALTTLLACLAMSPGCGGPPVIEEPKPPAPAASFALRYERAGGLAAMPQSLAIRAGRRATLTERAISGGSKTVRFRVAPRKVEALRHALATAKFGSIDSPGPNTGCADCYLYTLVYKGHEVSFDQTDEPPELGDVLTRIQALIDAH